MSRKKKSYKAEFKARVVLELLESNKTLNEIASENEILPVTLSSWKRQFLENMTLAFDKSSVVKEYKEEIETLKREGDALAKKLGKTIVEKDWAVGKLKSLDLSTKKSLVDKTEGVQASSLRIPSLTNSTEPIICK
ncbi:transposase [bacterium]|nr:transposase [bacterium]